MSIAALILELENWGRWARSYTGPDRYQPSICALFMPHKYWDESWGDPPPPPKIDPPINKPAAERMERYIVALGYHRMKLIRAAFAFGNFSIDRMALNEAIRLLADSLDSSRVFINRGRS